MNRVKLKLLWMSEGRRTQIILLDDRKLDIVVQPRLLVDDLLRIAASHCALKEPDRQYFGLSYLDEKNQSAWLQPDRRVLEHDFPRKATAPGATLVLHFMVKFFVDSITELESAATVELFFLQAKANIRRRLISCDHGTLPVLCACILQAHHGDFTNDQNVQDQILKGHFVPDDVQGAPYVELVSHINQEYQKLKGLTKGQALVKYMTIVEELPTYGMHFYEIRDKFGSPFTIALCRRGIFLYDSNQFDKPKRVFQWKHLENLYYRDRKFSVEVHDPRRVTHALSSFNLFEDVAMNSPGPDSDDLERAIADPTTQVSVSRRTFGPNQVRVHVFFCETAQMCKLIWSVAISQHQFYLDQSSATKVAGQTKPLDEIANELNQASRTLKRQTSDLGSSVSTQSLHSIHSTSSVERAEVDRQRDLEVYRTLKEKKLRLERDLIQRMKELRDVCVREGDITGELPPEIVKVLGPGERKPAVKKRVGTSFTLSHSLMQKQTKADQINKMEVEVEIQRKIVAAQYKLANDPQVNKSLKRKRKGDYRANCHKLKQLEQKLHQLRLSSSKPDLSSFSEADARYPGSATGTPRRVRAGPKSAPTSPLGSMDDLSSLTLQALITPARSVVNHDARPPLPAFPSSRPMEQHAFIPPTPKSPLHEVRNSPTAAATGSQSPYRSPAYQSQYRTQTYPVLTTKTQSSHSLSSSSTSASADYDNVTLPPMSQRSNSSAGQHAASMTSVTTTQEFSPSSKYHSGLGEVAVHNVGAYNIVNQRTSWNYDSIDHVNVVGGSQDNLGELSATSASYNTPRQRTPPVHFYGSLDRKLLKARQRDRFVQAAAASTNGQQHIESPLAAGCRRAVPQEILEMERSPTRKASIGVAANEQLLRRASYNRKFSYPSALNDPDGLPPVYPLKPKVEQLVNEIELTKSYETSDYLKYSARSRCPSAGALSPRNFGIAPLSPGATSPGVTSPKLNVAQKFSEEMLTWFDDRTPVKQSTGTIV